MHDKCTFDVKALLAVRRVHEDLPVPSTAFALRGVARGGEALLPAFAAALGVTTDELLGVATPRKKAVKPDRRLQRRMQQIERMNPKEKRQALQILDALIERDQLRAKG